MPNSALYWQRPFLSKTAINGNITILIPKTIFMEKKLYRPFQISCGLREGYDLSATQHTLDEARTIIQNWIEQRLTDNKKVAVGSLITAQYIYPVTEDEKISSSFEPAFHYKGMIREDASDEEAEEMLFSLARELSQTLNQKRVHIELGSSYFLHETV